jgi:hypothetical protein
MKNIFAKNRLIIIVLQGFVDMLKKIFFFFLLFASACCLGYRLKGSVML